MAFIVAPGSLLRAQSTHKAVCKRRMGVAKWKCCVKRDEDEDVLPLELVEGYVENANVKPRIDVDADETMLMVKLRRMLHPDDYKRIFDEKSKRIGEL